MKRIIQFSAILFLLVCPVFAHAAGDSTGFLVWSEDGANGGAPHYMVFNPSTPDLSGTELDLQADEAPTSDTNHLIVEAAPNRHEYIMGRLNAAGHIDVQVYTEGAWANGTNAPTNGDFATTIGTTNDVYRAFDIAYESNTGDGLVVYENSSTGDGQLVYRVWDGNAWSNAQTIDYSGVDEGDDVARWVECEADYDSDNILCVWREATNLGLYGARWDGSAWQHISAIDTADGQSVRHDFDVAWDGSGNGMVVYGLAASPWLKAATYTTGGGFSDASTGIAAGGAATQWVRIAGSPNNDYIAVMFQDTSSTSSADMNVEMWNGSNWTTVAVPTADADINSNGFGQGMDVAWSYNDDQALFVWRDGTTSETTVRWMVYDISAGQFQAIDDNNYCNLTATEQVTSLANAEGSNGPCTDNGLALATIVTGVNLTPDPSTDDIMFLAEPTTAALITDAQLYQGNGVWLSPQGTNMNSYEADMSTGANLSASLPVKAYDFAFRKSSDANVAVSGTQMVSMIKNSTANYVGGVFAISGSQTTANVTSITITEQGTIDGQELDNVALYYESDTSSPYNCASETYDGTEDPYGSAVASGFNAANGTATFTDSIAITPTSALCVYVVFDVSNSVSAGQTIEIEITDPTSDVAVDAGTIGPAFLRDLPGSTTIVVSNDLTISSSATSNAGSAPNWVAGSGGGNVNVTDIQTQINAGTSVSFTASGNITVSNAFAKSSGGDVSMTMNANGSIDINAAISSSTGQMDMVFNTDRNDLDPGYINISAALTSNGGDITMGGGSGTISAGSGFARGNAGQEEGVLINGVTVAAGGGNIIINGQGYDASTDSNPGVVVTGASGAVTTTGSGTIQITANGAGNTDSGASYGLSVNTGGIISSVNGNLTVTAAGGGAGAGNNNYGVYVVDTNSTIETTGSGNLSVTGTGGNASGSGAGNHGVFCNVANCIQTTSTGTLTVTGYASSGGLSNYGVYVTNGSITGAGGAMTINGTGSGSSDNDQLGVFVTTGGSITNTGSGTMDVTAVAGGATSSAYDYGLSVANGGVLSTVNGNLTVVATGGGIGVSTDNHGVYIQGVNSTIETTGSGDVSVTGTGGNSTGNGQRNHGVYCNTTSCIQTTSTGAITVTGFGSSLSAANNYGVYVTAGSITGNGGAMTINGTGAASSGSNQYGVYVGSSGVISNIGTGTINVNGTGGGITNSASDYGIYVSNNGDITTEDGDLTVVGIGGGAGTGANTYGVYLTSTGSTMLTSGSGDIFISGVRGGGASATNYGVRVNASNAIRTTGTGDITVNCDTILLGQANNINSVGNLTIAPYTASETVGIAGTGSSGTLDLTSTFLGYLTYASLQIGDSAQTGATTVETYASWAAPVSFVVNASGSIVINGAQTNSSSFSFTGPTTLSADIDASDLTIVSGAFDAGSATMTLSGTGTVFSNSGTFTAGTSMIKLTDASASGKTFAGGGGTYHDFWFAPDTGTGSLTITGSNTFADFKDDGSAAHSILFTAGTTQTLSTWTVSGSSGNLIAINSGDGAGGISTSTHTLFKSSGTVSADYLNIQHSVATGGASWYAGNNSTDNQAVSVAGSGWIFTPPSGGTNIKTINGLLKTSVKTVNGLGIASIKAKNVLQ